MVVSFMFKSCAFGIVENCQSTFVLDVFIGKNLVHKL